MPTAAGTKIKWGKDSSATRDINMLKMELPIMLHTMNTANIVPYGRLFSVSAVARAGVHKKTKVYMAPSKADCAAPK